MNFQEWVEHQDREAWPWLLPGALIDLVMESADMVETPSGLAVDMADYLTALRERIGMFNQELIDARTRDEVAAVEARVRLFRDDEQRIMDGFHRIAIEGLRRTR